jgi:hypothetical protein
MTAAELSNYRNWHDRTAAQILYAVQNIRGGWATVFPKGIPCWASRVRNYFNVTPHDLMRFDKERERANYNKHFKYQSGLAWYALHGAVYKDKQNLEWLQMSSSATVYHYEGEVNASKHVEAFMNPQSRLPIFKLISPDGTGGSRELILTNPSNWLSGDSTVVKVLHWKRIRDRVVLQETYAGSYNYAETITLGYKAHEKADVKTHREWPGFYLNPNPDSLLSERGFPERDRRGALLADQIEYTPNRSDLPAPRGGTIPRSLAASHSGAG